MRKINAFLTIVIMVLLLDHALFGGLQMMGLPMSVFKPEADLFCALVAVRALIGVKMLFDTVKCAARDT